MAHERANAFDFWGPKTLIGPELKPGDRAPAFRLARLSDTLSSEQLAGKPLVISVIPSIDTGVCSRQTHRFNQAAAALGDAITILAVSADLPFTQSRWCAAEGVDTMLMASDHLDMSFGNAYGTHIKELRFESRAAFVIDAQGLIRYAEYVPNGGQEPNYDAVLEALRVLA